MTLTQTFLAELKHEAVSTRKMLERVPFDKSAWKPHEKSSSMLHLAAEIAAQPGLIEQIIRNDQVDFAKNRTRPAPPASTAELLVRFDENMKSAEAALSATTDEHLEINWVLRYGERLIHSGSRSSAIRRICLCHWIHHRGQLSVYLRLLNIPVPSIYGPSADDKGA